MGWLSCGVWEVSTPPGAKLEFDAGKIAQAVYIRATNSGWLEIICNQCGTGADKVTFFSGPDYNASLGSSYWLAKAVQHMLEEHPDKC